jgi:3-dehydroquinate synthase
MVDASVGGKNGVDLGNIKKSNWCFQPGNGTRRYTISRVASKKEMRSGLAEMLKHGLIYDKSYGNNS